MRNLFLVLVLANLGFAAWHAWFTGTGPPPGRAASAGSGITLVKELDGGRGATASSEGGPEGGPKGSSNSSSKGGEESGAESGAEQAQQQTAPEPAAVTAANAGAAASGTDGGGATAATAPPGRAGPSTECVSVGPFPELAQAAAASAKLRAAGYEPVQRAGEGDVWVGYWVYLDDIRTRDEADKMLAKLHDNGAPDSYLIPDGGDAGDRISLGVFSEVERAGRLRDRLRALGFEPVVVDRTRHENVYWIDVTLPAGRRLDFETLQTPGRITRLEQRSCPAAGG